MKTILFFTMIAISSSSIASECDQIRVDYKEARKELVTLHSQIVAGEKEVVLIESLLGSGNSSIDALDEGGAKQVTDNYDRYLDANLILHRLEKERIRMEDTMFMLEARLKRNCPYSRTYEKKKRNKKA